MIEVYASFEGGGVRGTALVGAVAAAEEAGIVFKGVAGTSCGAIIAALIAVGYSASEMYEALINKDYKDFKDPISVCGIKWLLYYWAKGLYKGNNFHKWFNELLEKKIKKRLPTFNDIKIPLAVVATDISRQQLEYFKGPKYSLNSNFAEISIADAVRASMSIPAYFVPFNIGDVTYVDGGILNNFPLWIFEEEQKQNNLPILGFRLDAEAPLTKINNIQDLTHSIINTVIKENIKNQVNNSQKLYQIPIPTLDVKTTDFEITNKRKEELYQFGYMQAKNWFLTNTIS